MSSGFLALSQCRCHRMPQGGRAQKCPLETRHPHRELCVPQPRPEWPQQEKSAHRRPPPFFPCCGWLTTPARGSMWYVCAQATPAWASFVFTALDMAPWTFFPYVGILEFKNRMAPLFGWLPLQYSLFKKKGGRFKCFSDSHMFIL